MTINEVLKDPICRMPRMVITSVQIPADVLYDLENLAGKIQKSRSQVIRAAVRLLLHEYRKEVPIEDEARRM